MAEPLPDFDLEDEEVRLAVREAAGYFRCQIQNFECVDGLLSGEARKIAEFFLKTGMVNNLDEFVEGSWCHNNYDDVPIKVTDWTHTANAKVRGLTLGDGVKRYRIPSEIQKFDQLESLTLNGNYRVTSESIGEGIVNMSSLKKIYFDEFTSEQPFPFPHNTEEISVAGEERWGDIEERRIEITDGVSGKYVLLSLASCNLTSLQALSLRYGNLDESHLEITLLNLLPKSPNLRKIDFSYNIIKSVTAISERLLTFNEDFIYGISSLQVLVLYGNPALKDTGSVSQFLELFPSITNIGLGPRLAMMYEKLQYQVDLNQAGRRLLPNKHVLGNTKSRKPIALSVWPHVLEKSTKRMFQPYYGQPRVGNFDGIYFLLRHGPALLSSGENATEPAAKRPRVD